MTQTCFRTFLVKACYHPESWFFYKASRTSSKKHSAPEKQSNFGLSVWLLTLPPCKL